MKNAESIMRAILRGARVNAGPLAVAPMGNRFAVLDYSDARGALALATADPLYAAETFVRLARVSS